MAAPNVEYHPARKLLKECRQTKHQIKQRKLNQIAKEANDLSVEYRTRIRDLFYNKYEELKNTLVDGFYKIDLKSNDELNSEMSVVERRAVDIIQKRVEKQDSPYHGYTFVFTKELIEDYKDETDKEEIEGNNVKKYKMICMIAILD